MDTSMTSKNFFRPGNIITTAGTMILIMQLAMPARLLLGQASTHAGNTGGDANSGGITITNVNAIAVDQANIKWFITDTGLLSFDGNNWKLHGEQEALPDQGLKDVTFVNEPVGAELWIASPEGATVARLPMEGQETAITLSADNTPMPSSDVISIAAGKDSIRWIGTAKGISALCRDRWLTPAYDLHYPDVMFGIYPITSMATNHEGDTLYVGTAGAGVARVYRDDVDGISGASVYAIWGPIMLPSDDIRSVFIAPDGSKWFGTTDGIARHTGNNTLDHWTVYTTEDGLIDNFVQAICGDSQGHIWFGTKNGISVFDGSSWRSYTTEDGLVSNNILSLASDREGVIWIGTDVGINACREGVFTAY